MTIRLSAETKNQLIDAAAAFDLTVTDYLTTLIWRDAEPAPVTTSSGANATVKMIETSGGPVPFMTNDFAGPHAWDASHWTATTTNGSNATVTLGRWTHDNDDR